MAEKSKKAEIANKSIKIEATIEEWVDLAQNLDGCQQILTMIRKQAKERPEADGADAVVKAIPEMVMGINEAIATIRQSVVKNLSHEEMKILALD